jgi:hypothetical protein
MSTIGNRFYVTALEDGTTLHGNLVSVGSLTQGWVESTNTPVPNWKTETDKQPIIYLTLLSGNDTVNPDSNNQKWYYNDVELTFGSNGKSTNTGLVDVFQRTTYPEANPNGAPALKIIDNLASSSNVDLDTIRFSGQYTSSGAAIEFAATIQVRITSMTAGSNLGVIEFANGISDITQKDQTISMTASLYSSEGKSVSSFQTAWMVNGVEKQSKSSTKTFSVKEGEIVDHAIIQCDFYDGDNKLYSAYAAIDDMQDSEFMYIQYNGNNGNAASLRKNESATFQVWVGTRDSSNVLMNKSVTPNVPMYGYIAVKLIDGEGIPIGGKDDTTSDKTMRSQALGSVIPACVGGVSGDGWRNYTQSMSQGKATITIPYDVVNDADGKIGKKNLTGVIIAYTENPFPSN